MKKTVQIIAMASILSTSMNAQVMTLTLSSDSAYQSTTGPAIIAWWGASFSPVLDPNLIDSIDGDTSFLFSSNKIITEICSGTLSESLFIDFSPNLPTGSVIQGFQINTVKYGFNGYSLSVYDQVARLLINGTSISNNQAITSDIWPYYSSAPSVYSYGGSSDLWGLTLPSQTNKVTFELQAYNNGLCTNIALDFIELKIYYTSTVDIEDVKAQNQIIQVYPNPAQDEIVVNLNSSNTKAHVEIIDALGQVLKTQNMSSSQERISVADLPIGAYFVRVNQNQQIPSVERLVIVR